MTAVVAETDAKRARPFLKWAGGKGQLLEELRKHVPMPTPGRTYFEPFCGGAAVFFGMNPTPRAILSDSNVALISTMKAVRESADSVIRALTRMADNEVNYYNTRQLFNEKYVTGTGTNWATTPHGGAACMIFLNRTCFNGLWRVTKRAGTFNAPYDGTRPGKRTICDVENLKLVAQTLNATHLVAGDFEQILRTARRGDVVYCDPPYVPASATADFTAYTKDPFGPTEQERLMKTALDLKKRGATVVLSNSDTPFVRKLYSPKNFKLHEVKATRRINSKAGGRGSVNELIIT